MERADRFSFSRKPRALEVRFFEKVELIPFHTCWEWIGSLRKGCGYGQLKNGNRMNYAHRLSWEIHNGPIENNLWVLHRCDNKTCVNPLHLFLGSPKDNVHDMQAKGRAKFVHRRVANGKVICRRGHEKVLLPNQTNKYVCRVCMNSWHTRNKEKFKAHQQKYKNKMREK